LQQSTTSLEACDMGKFMQKLADRMELAAMKIGEVGRIDGIGIAYGRWREDHRDLFLQTAKEALSLIRENDPRRYARVKRYIKWIVDRVNNTMGAEYDFRNRICTFEFYSVPGLDQTLFAAIFASFIVHEATHGAIESRGIIINETTRSRIERLCTAEQNRFAAKLSASDPERFPPEVLQVHFDEKFWEWEWTATPGQRRRAFISRWFGDMKGEPFASPNGGSVGPVGKSKVKEAPPSTS
jgi:hypothetical protein